MIIAEHFHAKRGDLVAHLSWRLASLVAARGVEESTVALSGGATPKPLMQAMASRPQNWRSTCFTLVDDRCVPAEDPRSNRLLVAQNLLTGPSPLKFQPLYSDTETLKPLKLDFAVLGMGGDGHTASLFPGAPELERLLSTEAPFAAFATATQAPLVERATYSGRGLQQAQRLFLHIEGEQKRAVYEQAKTASPLELPIAWFIRQPEVPLEVFWAP